MIGDPLLFIQSYLNGNEADLKFKLAIVAFMWGIVTIAMLIDLRSGLRKAKERGEISTSYGYRETVKKANLYYALMTFAFLADCIGTFFYPLPFMTLVASLSLVFIEGKSVLEKAHEKDKRKIIASTKEIVSLIKDRDFINTLGQLSDSVEREKERQHLDKEREEKLKDKDK